MAPRRGSIPKIAVALAPTVKGRVDLDIISRRREVLIVFNLGVAGDGQDRKIAAKENGTTTSVEGCEGGHES